MFFAEVTNIRSPTILAPVVMPTSCLIEPRYSTLGDITASGRGGVTGSAAAPDAALAAAAVAASRATTTGRRTRMPLERACAPVLAVTCRAVSVTGPRRRREGWPPVERPPQRQRSPAEAGLLPRWS